MALKKQKLNDVLMAVANGQSIIHSNDRGDIKYELVEKKKEAKTRVATKVIAGHFDKAVSMQLRQIALDEETTVQDLLKEAINDLFEKRGKGSIA
jgi:sulfur carrier protein ThiS